MKCITLNVLKYIFSDILKIGSYFLKYRGFGYLLISIAEGVKTSVAVKKLLSLSSKVLKQVNSKKLGIYLSF